MLKGDLTSTPLAPLLRDLANDSSTGCLHVTNPAGEEAQIFFKNGLVYSVSVPGTRPQLGAKLVSSGALAPEALAEALEAQRTELQGWRLGELLVHLGYVDQPVVEAFVLEQVNEALWDLLRWSDGRWKFRKNIRAREDIGPPMVVVELLATLRDRGYEWENISAVVHGPSAVPVLSASGGGDAETTLDNDAWSMLCKIDGERSVADLARDCGYTLFEAGQVMVQLVQAGLVDIEEDLDVASTELYGATTLSEALAGHLDDAVEEVNAAAAAAAEEDAANAADAAEEDVLSRLARLVNEVAGDHSHDGRSNGVHADDAADGDSSNGDGGGESRDAEPDQVAPILALAPSNHSGVTSFENPMIVPLHRHSSESFAASIARVSNALSDVLGETPDTTEADSSSANQSVALKRSRSSTSDPEWQRRKRLRSAAAAELASAQAMVETLRADHDVNDTETAEEPAAAVEADVETDIEIAEVDPADAVETVDTDVAADTDESADTELAAEQTAAQLGAEQAEAEQAEAVQAEAERLAAEEAERLAAEEAERLAVEVAERTALEELAWAEYWQLEGEERAAEQAEVERLAAEETERIAAEQAEAERIAAEEEAQRAAEEAERAAAEEAERLAAEQAEAERIAAEEEAERIAAEEAAQLAAEKAERAAAEEAERLAMEEAERSAAEQAEAERIAAEEEAERAAAEEAERIAAEQAETDRVVAEEAERVVAEEAAQQAAAQAELDALNESERLEEEEASRDATSAKEERARRKAEKQAAEDAARESDEAAAATALLVELAATTATTTDEPAAETTAEAEEPTAAAEEPEEAFEAWTDAGQADTAALLRELSSLGMDDDEPSVPTPQHKPRPPSADKKTKKKIGLFGL